MSRTVLEITDPSTAAIVPIVVASIDVAAKLQALLYTNLDIDSDIVFAGIDPEQLFISPDQHLTTVGIMRQLDDALRAEVMAPVVHEQERIATEYGPTVVSLCAFRAEREIQTRDMLSFDM